MSLIAYLSDLLSSLCPDNQSAGQSVGQSAMIFYFKIVSKQTKYCLAFAVAQHDKLPKFNIPCVKPEKVTTTDMGDTDTFMYFAYGSNLLKRRIRINNPSAEFVGIGRLDNHQIDFIKHTTNWNGASATIVPTEGLDNEIGSSHHIWGAIWRVQNRDMPALDRQEGVDSNWYFPKIVAVTMPNGQIVECRTYQQTINPPVRTGDWDLPSERLPSRTYMECIINGAIECELPENYIQTLKKIPHNNKLASPELLEKLKL